MIVQDISFPVPQENLDLDDELLQRAESEGAGESLRFWESPRVFVVLGRSSEENEDVDSAACRKDDIPVLRRSSGGGTVVQGPGCLNFSLVLSKDERPGIRTITGSYREILQMVLKSLGDLGIGGEFRLISDLVVPGTEKKFSGNAQRRGRRYILHHGTILYGFDLELISRYLKLPVRMPDYRRGRGHADFVTNIPVRPDGFKRSIARIFSTPFVLS